MPFPQANEDTLRVVSDEYRQMAEKFREVEELLRQVVVRVDEDFEGETATRFVTYARQFVERTNGNESILERAYEDAIKLSKNAHKTAADIEYTKWMIFGQLALLVVQIALAQALMPVTAGLSEIWAAAAIAAFRSMAVLILKFLLAQIIMQTITGLVGGLLLDSILQLTQIGRGDRTEWNKDFTADAAKFAAIGGVLGGPFALLGGGLGKLLGNLGGKGLGKILGNDAANVLGKGLAGGGKGAGGAAGGAGKAAGGLGKGAGSAGAGAGKGAGAGAGAAGKGAGAGAGAAGKGAGAGAGAAGKGAGSAGAGAGKGAGAAGDGAAGAGARAGADAAGQTISEESARKLGERLGNIMGRTNESLNHVGADGARGAAAGAVGREVVKDFANAFEKNLGDSLGNETARNLGREYGEALVKNWGGKADWQGLTHSLDDALKPYVKDLGEGGVRALSHDLPGSFVQTISRNIEGNLGFRIGNFVGEIAGESGHAVVTEGMYNLIFGPEHKFTVSGWTAAAGAAGGIMGRGVAHGFQALHHAVQGPPAAPPPRPPVFSSDSPTPPSTAPRPSTESNTTVRDGSGARNEADNRTLTGSASDSGSDSVSPRSGDDNASDSESLYYLDVDDFSDSRTLYSSEDDGNAAPYDLTEASAPSFATSSNDTNLTNNSNSTSFTDDGNFTDRTNNPNAADDSGDSTTGSRTPEPVAPPDSVPELDLLLNGLPDVPETLPSPEQAPENVTPDLRDVNTILEGLPDVPDTVPGTVLSPEAERLLADLPEVPRNDLPRTSDDGSGVPSSSRTHDSGPGNRTTNNHDPLQERLDRITGRQNFDDTDSDLAARMAKLRESGSDRLAGPARVDELRKQYRAALEEEGTDGTTDLKNDGALPYNGAGGPAAPPRPVPNVSTAPGAGVSPGGSRQQTPAGPSPSPDGLDALFPEIPRNEPGAGPFAGDEPDLVFPDVPDAPPGSEPPAGSRAETERTESENDGTGAATDDPPNPLRTESQDELPFRDGFDVHNDGDVDALITRLDELGGVTDDPVTRLEQLPVVPEGPARAEQRRLARDVERETDALLSDARRVGVDRETRRRLGERIRDDVRAGRHADAADGLRELGDLVAEHGLGERLQQFRRHMDGGYEARAAQLGMRRTEWLRHALDIEQSVLGGDPRRTTQLLDEFENRLGTLGSELSARVDSTPEALRKQLADSRRADAEEAGMDRERFLEWEDRREQAATPEDLRRVQAGYDAELETSRRLATLRDLGASERELATWKSRFEGPGRGSDLDALYERRTVTLGREAELASYRARLDSLRESGNQQESSQPLPPPQDGPGDGTPARDRSGDSRAENDRILEERLDRLREGTDDTGMSREERQQWEERHANAEDETARQAVEREQLDRMAQLERDRRLKTIADGDPEGAQRSTERRAAWQNRLAEAADDPQAIDRILDGYDAETAELRREGQERLERELRAPDRLRDLDRRIDRSLDKLPEEIRRQAAHDARTLVERLRNLVAPGDGPGTPKGDDAVPEKSTDVQDPDPAGTSGPSNAGPSATTRNPASRTNVDEGAGNSAKTPRPAGSEPDRRAPVQPGEQLMEAPRQLDDAPVSGEKGGESLPSRERDDLPSPATRRVRTQTEEDTQSLTDPRTASESESHNDVALTSDDTSGQKADATSGLKSDDKTDHDVDRDADVPSGKRPGNDDADSVASVPRGSEGPAKANEEPPGGPGGDGSAPAGSSGVRQPSARDKALSALSADEYEQRMYRARRDRPDLTTEEALRDEVFRRIENPGVKVETTALAPPLLSHGVDPLPQEGSGRFVTFDDNAMLPKSMKGHGHGRITIRGVDLLADSVATQWRLRPDGLDELKRVLTQSPHTLLSPRTFVLPTVDGGHREISLAVESYGNWRRHAEPSALATPDDVAESAPSKDGNNRNEGSSTTPKAQEPQAEAPRTDTAETDASRTDESKKDATKTDGTKAADAPVKIETELRTRPGATETKSLGTSRAFGVAVPLGPSAGTFGALGSVSLTARRMEAGYTYTQESRAQSSVTAVGKGGSHLHVSDLHIVVESSHVWDKKGRERPADQQRAGTAEQRRYRIRDGVTWRVPDSVTDPAIPDRLPTAFVFAPGARPHLLAPLGVTTETRLLDWALRNFPEAAPGSFLRHQLADLFGEESLRTMIAQSSGETVVSAPLFAGLGNRSLGSVELRLIPVDATLLQASDKTEVKKADAQRSTATTEKKNTQGAGIGISAGPQLALLQPAGTLNLQVAGSAGLTTQRAESSYSGNTAESVRTLNSRGHSGLYDVRFRVELRRQGGVWESPVPVDPTGRVDRNDPNEAGAFLTATVQLPRADARRLAGWDDGTAPVPDAEAPPAPAYLSLSNPATFGLHAVLDLTATRDSQSVPPQTSLTDELVDRLRAGLHHAYPDLVLPPRADTAVTGDRNGGSDRTYNNAVRNTHLLRQALSRTVLEGSLDRLTSTGLRIQLEQLDSVNKRYVVLTVRAEATDRRFVGTHHDLGLANNVLSTRRADSATTRTHGWSVGVDVGLTGIERFGGTGSIGYRYGRQTAYGMTYGPTLTPDGGITSSGSQHLWSYNLTFAAEATSFTRPRQIARTMTGELLSTRWFVKQAAGSVDVLTSGQAGGQAAQAPVTGRVTLAVPASLSVPSVLPVNRPETVPAPVPVPMDRAMAELLSSGKPVSTDDWTPHALFDGLHSVQGVTSPEVVLHHLKELLASVSGKSWIYGTDGTPASGALAEAFAVGRNEADFSDAAQTGKHVSDLFGRTAVTDITASVSAWPQVRGTRVLAVVDSRDLALSNIGSGTSGAGHSVAHVRSHTISSLLAFRAKHTDAFQTAGTYGLAASPYQRTSTATTAETFSANPAHTVQCTGPMVLVSADVAWHLAARSQPSGLLQAPMELMRGRPPQGRIVEIPDGLLVWLPLAEARKAGLFDDGLTAAPPPQLYTAVDAAAHATLTVGRLDMAPAISAFTNRLLETLPKHKSWLGPRSLLADQLGGLARQMTTLSPSGMRALQTGMENGGTSLRLARNKIGPAKDASLTVTLERSGFTAGALRHDVKPTITRPTSTAETVTEKLARGYEAGYRLGEVPTVLGQPGLRSGGFTLDDRVGSTRSSSLAHAVTDAVSAQVAFEGPVVTGRTGFDVTFTLELPDGTVVSDTYPVGDAEVVLPLSLARPRTTEQRTTEPRTGPSVARTPREAARPVLLPPDQQQAVALRERNAAGRKLFAAGPESVVVTTVGGITVLRDAAAYAVDLAVKGRGATSDTATAMPAGGNGRYVRRTELTRPGTAAGEALKGAISTEVLSAYLPQMVRDSLTITLHDTTSTIGGSDANLKISADVDLSGARLLAVDPQAGLGGSRRTMDNDTYTGDTTEAHMPAMTAGPGFQTQPLVQTTAAVPGWADSDAAGGAADRRTSALTTLKPFAGGAVLVQAPLRVLQTAKASHRIADLPVVPSVLRSGSRPPVTVEHTVQDGVTMWVSFDVAREHGLLPPEVEAAAVTVKEQTKKYIEAAEKAETAERRLRALDGEASSLRTELRRLLETPTPTGTDVATARERLATARSRYAEAQQDLVNHRRDLATAEQRLAGASEAAWKAVEHYTITGPRPSGTPPVTWSEPAAAAAVDDVPVMVAGYPPLAEALEALEALEATVPHAGPAAGLTGLPHPVTRQDVLARTEFWLGDAGPLPDTDAVRREQTKAAGWAQRLRVADAAYRSSLEAVRTARHTVEAAQLREARARKTPDREVTAGRFDAVDAELRDARSAYDGAVAQLTADYRELALVQTNFDSVDASTRQVLEPRPEGSVPRVVTPWHPAPEPEGYIRPADATSVPDPYIAQGKDTEGRPVALKAPDGRVLHLVEPPSVGPARLDAGTSFHRSLLDAVERAHPGLLAELGLHARGRSLSAADVQHLRERLADRLMADRDELAEFLAIDPQERFTPQELTDAGITLSAAQAAEHVDSRGRLPDTVAAGLTPDQRLELARTTLLRSGDGRIGDRKDAGWNHSAGDLAALLAARVLGVPVTVVLSDLNHLTFSAPGTGTGGNTRSGVVLHMADDRYRPAVPLVTDDLLLNADSEITQQPAGPVLSRSTATASAGDASPAGPVHYVGAGLGPSAVVPKELNFVWLGGELTDGARANLRTWAAKAEEAQWKLTIWTDEGGRRNNKEFLTGLADSGTVHQGRVEDLFKKDKTTGAEKLPSKVSKLYEAARKQNSFAMASDIARYALLHKHGGVYLDVDLGPGEVVLRPEGVTMPRGDDTLPMFGPMLRDPNSVRKLLRLEENAPVTADHIHQAAEVAYQEGRFGNQFIVTHPRSRFMKQVLDNLPDINNKDAYARGVLELAMKSKNVGASTGPIFLLRQFNEHIKSLDTTHTPNLRFGPPPEFRVRTDQWTDWTRLDWLTEESENQETPQTTSAPARSQTLAKRLGDTVRTIKGSIRWGSGRSGSDTALLPNNGTLLTGLDPAPQRLEQDNGTPKDELVGNDGRKITFAQARQNLHTIRDATGEVIGYASHSDRDWAPRNDFYKKYRADETSFKAYRTTDDGKFVPVAEDETSPRTVPWRTGTNAPAGQRTPEPVFFDAHGSQDGVKLHIAGDLPLEVDGAQFARFMESLSDPDQPPAPVVLVACDTASVRSTDGGSVVRDAARAVPGRRWYAPDVAVGHVGPPTGAAAGGATGVLALLQDRTTGRQGRWVTASEPTALETLLTREKEQTHQDTGDGTKLPDSQGPGLLLNADSEITQQPAGPVLSRSTATASAGDASPAGPVHYVGAGLGPSAVVPKELNFVWLGGELTDGARANLRTWAAKAEEAQWKLTIWTDEGGRRNNKEFLTGLADSGTVHQGRVEDLFKKDKTTGAEKLPSKVSKLYEAARKQNSFAMASDIARYALLHKHGGVYLDVDLGPGEVVLRPEGVTMPRGDDTLPMFGPMLRDPNSVRKLLRLEENAPVTADHIHQAAEVAYQEGRFGNQFIVTHPRSRFMKQVLDNLPDINNKDAYARGVLELAMKSKNVGASTGPIFLLRQFNEHIKSLDTTHTPNLRFGPPPEFRVRTDQWTDWTRLDWLTEESENQETPQTTSAPARSQTLAKRLGDTVRTIKGSIRWGSGRSGSDTALLPNNGTLLTGLDPAPQRLEQDNGTPKDELVGNDGRKITFAQARQNLHTIRDATGEVIGYASHSDRDWAPRNDFYKKYRADEALFAHYRPTEEGGAVLDTDSDPDSPANKVPWQTGAPVRDAKEPVRPLFFDAHGSENGIELHVVGEKPLVVDGARFARFMETLRDPAQPPAPVVLVACETAKIRSGDGGSVATDAARAVSGRLWYAPDTEVGHVGPSNGSDGVRGVLGLLADPVAQRRGTWIVAGESPETGPAFVPDTQGEAVPPTTTFSDMIFETLNSASQNSAEQVMSDDLAQSGPEADQTEPAPPAPHASPSSGESFRATAEIAFGEGSKRPREDQLTRIEVFSASVAAEAVRRATHDEKPLRVYVEGGGNGSKWQSLRGTPSRADTGLERAQSVWNVLRSQLNEEISRLWSGDPDTLTATSLLQAPRSRGQGESAAPVPGTPITSLTAAEARAARRTVRIWAAADGPARVLRLLAHDGTPLDADRREALMDYVDESVRGGQDARVRLLLRRLELQNLHVLRGELESRYAERVAEIATPAGTLTPVPKDVHFFWMGEEPSAAALNNLEAWARSAGGRWQQHLWTDATYAEWSGPVRTRLEQIVTVHQDSLDSLRMADRPQVLEVYETAVANGAYNLASDIARYLILERIGGVYADVDLHPGTVDLSSMEAITMRSGDLPLLAPRVRDMASVADALATAGVDAPAVRNEQVDLAARLRWEAGVLGNHLIVAPPGSEFITSLLDAIPKNFAALRKHMEVSSADASQFAEELKNLAPQISGPAMIEDRIPGGEKFPPLQRFAMKAGAEGVAEFDGSSYPTFQRKEAIALFSPRTLEAFQGIHWVTAESERQLDGPVAEQPAAGPSVSMAPPHVPDDSSDAQVLSRPARQVPFPADPSTWVERRKEVPAGHVGRLHVERFDPAVDAMSRHRVPGTLAGSQTLMRAEVSRIEAHNGTWVRDHVVTLPVRLAGSGLSEQDLAGLRAGVQGALDEHFNAVGYALPRSGDQFNVDLRLVHDDDHPEHVIVSRSDNPGRSDQRHWNLGPPAEDHRYLPVMIHEVLHYLGLPDEYRDRDFLFRRNADSGAVHTDGLMADTARLAPLPERYLAAIEDTVDLSTVFHDHPLTAPGENPAVRRDHRPTTDPALDRWPTSRSPGNPADTPTTATPDAPRADGRGAGDSEIVDSWRALSTLPRARRSNTLRRIDTAVQEWANGGRQLPGAHDINQRQLGAILDAVEAWKSGKNGPSDRAGAVDRLTAHVRSEQDDLHQRIAERAHQAQLLDRYTRIHPDVSDFAGRRLPDRVDPANNPTHDIFTGDRTHHGALSDDALDAADELSRRQLAAKRDQAAAGGVTVDAGVSAERVRELMDSARNDLTRSTLYPELNSYLDRADQTEALDTGSHLGKLTPVVEDVHGTQVTIHGDPTDSLRDARIDNFRKAVITVQEAGFHVPDVELHLPKYGRFLEVHNDVVAERSGGRLQRAEYLAPNAVIASPDVVGNPLTNKLAGHRYRYLSTELDPSGVGTMVHELGHFLHYANARAQYHDLAFTQFAGRSGQGGDAVPHQALALGVSAYAAGNPREFVAEVFTGLVYGKPFSPEVMRMYHGLGGPDPTPRKDVRSPSASSAEAPGDA
ncbi:glycosyltransferase [Streptomyces sp. NPDC102437]|uniref:glycosyltransferase n=1 Tax=Streptomyces sp. NPDC102437 TaxID=3366175 RepID=UPI00380EF749